MSHNPVVPNTGAVMKHIIGALRRVKPDAVDEGAETLDASLLLGADLGLSSLDIVRFAGALQRNPGRFPAGGFHRLFINGDGSLATDVSIGRLISFLSAPGA